MREISITATVGHGNEIHNHDLEYRKTLKHVHDCKDGIIELIEYVDYQTKINAIMKPYIDEYNAKVEERYQKAWERYKAGETRSKPKKKDYQKMGYDYYSDHLNDVYYDQHAGLTKPLPLWREILIGLGDEADRKNGVITRDEAERILRAFVQRWTERFPNLMLLGASLHTDERGFYHCHIDYKPLVACEQAKGLNVSVSHEEAFKAMKLEPEQALINGRDKAPLRFNGFRNACYQLLREEMRKEGIYQLEGATAKKHPGKDATKKEDLDSYKARQDAFWNETQEKALGLQHQMNIIYDIIDHGEPSPENVEKIMNSADNFNAIMTEVQNSPKVAMRDERKVSFHLLDQLRTFGQNIAQFLGEIAVAFKDLVKQIGTLKADKATLEAENQQLAEENDAIISQYNELVDDYNNLLQANQELKEEIEEMNSFDGRLARYKRATEEPIRNNPPAGSSSDDGPGNR